jgi:3-methyl-2-oxobutanoate hydroxymethyltransferase
VPAKVAALLTSRLSIPVIGIGAGPDCDGQILVYHDMLGLFQEFMPKFVKRYAEAGDIIRNAFAEFVKEVQGGKFPGPEHCFQVPDEKLEKLY